MASAGPLKCHRQIDLDLSAWDTMTQPGPEASNVSEESDDGYNDDNNALDCYHNKQKRGWGRFTRLAWSSKHQDFSYKYFFNSNMYVFEMILLYFSRELLRTLPFGHVLPIMCYQELLWVVTSFMKSWHEGTRA